MEEEARGQEAEGAVREFQLAERKYEQARARGESDGVDAALVNMAVALSMLGMDPWQSWRGTADAPQEAEEQSEMDLSGEGGV